MNILGFLPMDMCDKIIWEFPYRGSEFPRGSSFETTEFVPWKNRVLINRVRLVGDAPSTSHILKL